MQRIFENEESSRELQLEELLRCLGMLQTRVPPSDHHA